MRRIVAAVLSLVASAAMLPLATMPCSGYWLILCDAGGSEGASSVVALPGGLVAVAGLTNSSGLGGFDLMAAAFNSTSGELLWAEAFGGELSEFYPSVASDGQDLLVSASTGSYSGYSAVLVKLRANGTMEWSKLLSVEGVSCEVRSVANVSGGFILAGKVSIVSWDKTYDYMLAVKIDGDGSVKWAVALGEPYSDVVANTVAATPDGGVVLAGYRRGLFELSLIHI